MVFRHCLPYQANPNSDIIQNGQNFQKNELGGEKKT